MTWDEPERTASRGSAAHGGVGEAPIDLVVSIGTRDNYDVLEQCVESVYSQGIQRHTCEVWIVYNGRQGEAARKKIEERFPAATVLHVPSGRGYCRVHNTVLDQAVRRSRYVLLLDDDTIVKASALD